MEAGTDYYGSPRMKSSMAIVLVTALCILAGCSKEKPETVLEESGTNRPGVIVIVNSKACKCTRERCASAEEYVMEALERHGLSSKLRIIDHAKELERAAELFIRYRIHFIPVVLVFDENGNVLYKNEDDIDHAGFEKALTQLKGRK